MASIPHDPATDAPRFYVTEEDHHVHAGSPTILGFWIYLMSDALLFAALFATYGVIGTSYAGGPVPREIFELPLVALNTAILLVSSITYGFAMLALDSGRARSVQLWLVVTGLLGIAFVGVEMYEFSKLIAEGATPQRSGFLSAFFTLVGAHGLHVTIGIIWIGVMLVQLAQRGVTIENRRRLLCLSMFWHFLDVVWIGVFTFVYLLGMVR
ncbi:cytochrome o ubiquinol oxidase subunit III [Altererythrobacter sp. TH136]|uniref:cytochrome o ubiquinol oxidase subunit III n=1 Tax=Altererythrobacter sp. TH136 TaxID=2067415 RepID=UPI0011652B64|nr:cytochrome o ubiquinol oxidase subunit III [Altererythrobacter sp. TH136]QDM40752.1 cytochrome o ubiquinol oxidase subunit III [Altererythrobacter sp. TH136]